jgi:hypothetical protein
VCSSLALVGCGRVAFDAAGDAPVVTGDGACAWGPLSAPSQLPGPVQSNADDWFPTPTGDELELYFYTFSGAIADAEIVRATRSSTGDLFSTAAKVTELNSPGFDSAPTLTDDGLDIVITRDNSQGPHLFEANRARVSDPFNAPVEITSLGAATNRNAFLSGDGLRIAFVRPQAGSLDLFEATRTTRTDSWGPATSLGEPNTAGEENDPTLSVDGLELFFTSTRAGSFDLYRATRSSVAEPFRNVELVAALSSPGDEVGPRLSRDGRTLYFNYNAMRLGGGDAQLWTSTRSLACARGEPTSTPAPR